MGILRSFLGRFFGPPSRDQFARIMVDAMARAGENRPHRYEPDEYRLVYTEDDKEVRVVNLANLYLEYCNLTRTERKNWLGRTIRPMIHPMEIPEEFEDVKPDLLPTVRPRSLVEHMRLDAIAKGKEPPEPAYTPLSEHLVVCLVYDLPSSMSFVMSDKLEQWGATLYEAMEIALANLHERPFTMLGLGEKLFIVESGDSYDGSRLLLKEHIRKLALKGRPVAIPVSRNTLFIAGEDDDEGLGIMAELAEKKMTEARPLCPIPVVLAGDDWETWLPPPGHPHYESYHRLELQYLHGEYAEQKTLLEKNNERTETEVFVASFSAVERDGRVLSWAIWSNGVPTWLPKTDYVALFDPETKFTQFVRWEKLRAVVESLMQPLEYYPPRWSVESFPTVEQIAEMEPENWSQ